MTNEKNMRKSNFELLRIIAMLMIVFSHYAFHTGFDYSTIPLLNRYYLHITTLGNLGVDLLVLISGFFLIKSSRKIKKVCEVQELTCFYSVAIFAVMLALGVDDFSIKKCVEYVFPVLFQKYWFVTSYIILLMISPFFNRFLKGLSKNEYKTFLALISILWVIIPIFTRMDFNGNDLIILLMLYSWGGYCRLFIQDTANTKRINLLLFLISLMVLLIPTALSDTLLKGHGALFFCTKTAQLPLALSIFIYFKDLKINNIVIQNVINHIAKSTFGVYLIHASLSRNGYLWSLFPSQKFSNDNVFILYSIGICMAVFFGCYLIDTLRRATIGRLQNRMIDYKTNLTNRIIDRIGAFLKNIN